MPITKNQAYGDQAAELVAAMSEIEREAFTYYMLMFHPGITWTACRRVTKDPYVWIPEGPYVQAELEDEVGTSPGF